jgi:hypothetical protein
MRWPFSRPTTPEEPRPWPPLMAHPVGEVEAADGTGAPGEDDVFACSTCGRTDLPPTGDWDPPICLECDAAINFDLEEEASDL